MIVSIYRCWVDGLSFEKTGGFVAKVEVPDGSSLKSVGGLFSLGRVPAGALLMVPCADDPSIRYAWCAVDVVAEAGNFGSRFRIVEKDSVDRHAIVVNVGAN